MSTVNPMTKFGWMVRREFWEYRGSFFWAPIVTALILLAFTLMALVLGEVTAQQHGVQFSGFELDRITANMSDADIAKFRSALDISLIGLCFPISLVLFFVLFFYAIGTLYNDRVDRSVLFWKSLPLSDTEMVLAKVAAVALLAPTLAIACMIGLQIGFLLIITIFASFHVASAIGLFWSPTHLISLWLHLIVRIPVNAIWALPCIGWLFLCSGFSRSKPFLWATLVPILSGVLVWWFSLMRAFDLPTGWYWKNIVGRALLSLFPGSWLWLGLTPATLNHLGNHPEQAADTILSLDTLGTELLAPDLWIGAIAGVAMIVAAIYFRRRRIEAFA